MVILLCVLCTVLGLIIIILTIKMVLLHKAAEQIRVAFAQKLSADSNTGIEISTEDPCMKRLAADIDRQLKLLRAQHLRYITGDMELKNAVTGISHDLRTPLTAICGYMDLLKEEEMTDRVKNYLSIIENRVKALKDLTEELFDYSVVLSQDTGMEREAVSLNRAVEDSIAEFYGAFKGAGIEPVITMPEEPIVRQLNPQAVSRILSNIMGNAIKYSDGDFYVSLLPEGRIVFRNRADKLDEIAVGHLFDRFYTVESASVSTGLGLSIAKNLTEEMGGHIEACYAHGELKIELYFQREYKTLYGPESMKFKGAGMIDKKKKAEK